MQQAGHAPATAEESPAGDRKGSFALLLTASLVSSLIMLDSNIVAVSLPAIGHALNAGFADIQWVISAYVLTYAALLLGAGAFADLYGRRRAMLIGLAIFALSSAACGAAPSAMILNLSRAAQGIGGALLLTASLAIISNAFSGKARTRAFAFWGAALGVALTLGPIAGGSITSYFGWRWIFLVNIPLSALLIAMTLASIAETHDREAKRLDYAGVATFSCGLGLLIWALIDGNDAGWTSLAVTSRLLGSVVLFAAFVFVELRQQRPMVDFGLFGHPTFVGAVIAMMGYGASAQVMVFYLPLFLQSAYRFDPVRAGFGMLPFALPMILAPRLTSTLATRLSGRAILCLGLAITLAGNILFWLIAHSGASYGAFVVGMLVAGAGAGLLNGETVKVIQGAVPEERAGMASGLASTTRFIGILVAVAGLGAVLSAVTTTTFMAGAANAGLDARTSAAMGRLVTSGNFEGIRQAVPGELQERVTLMGTQAFAQGFAKASIVAAIVAAAALILTFVLVRSSETAPDGNDAASPVPAPSKVS